jgi:uncharacterized membrane protein YhaH (DUF805 family)
MDYVWLLFSFKGRINRARYLVVQGALLTFWFMLFVKLSIYFSPQWQALVFYWVVAITMIWINAATTAKRLHDRDRSGWWAVAIFIFNRLSYVYYGLFFGLAFGVDISTAKELPLVMLAVALSLLETRVIIELFFLIGTDGRNRFGPDPLSSVANGAPTTRSWANAAFPDFWCTVPARMLGGAMTDAGACTGLERDDFSSNRLPALSFCLSMIFSENRYPLFRIML